MNFVYWLLVAAYLGWLLHIYRSCRMLRKWLGNDSHDPHLLEMEDGRIRELASGVTGPLAAWIVGGALALGCHIYWGLSIWFDLALLVIAHLCMAAEIYLLPRRASDLRWIWTYRPPEPTRHAFLWLLHQPRRREIAD